MQSKILLYQSLNATWLQIKTNFDFHYTRLILEGTFQTPKWAEKKHHGSSYSSFNEFYNEIYNTDAVTRLNIYMCFNYVCVLACVCSSVITSSSDTQTQWAAWLILIHLIRKLTISRMNTDNVGNCCHWILLTDEFIKTRECGCWTETFTAESNK